MARPAHLVRLLLLAVVLAAGWACTESVVSVIDVDVVQVQPATATRYVGESVQLAAETRDAKGNRLTGRTVQWTSGAASVASVTASGMVQALAPGEATITATSEGVRGTAVITVVARPVVASLEIVSGNGQTATVDSEVAQPPRVRARDGDGDPLAGVLITWSVTSGGGTLAAASPVPTGSDGIAAAPAWRLGQAAGQNTLRAMAQGLPDAPVTFTATGIAGAAAGLAFETAPPTVGRSGVPLTPQPAVQLSDGFGNAVASAGVTVTAALMSGGGELNGTVSVATDAAGIARFTNLAITGAVGERVLVFSAPALASLTSAPLAITAGSAARLTVVQQPSSSASVAAPLAVQPVVQLLDVNGNVAAEAGVPVTASIASGGGELSGTLTVVTDGTGRASFTGLSISGLIGPRTLRFAAPGLAAATSNPIQLNAGAPAALGLTTQPPLTIPSGAVFSRSPLVQLLDAGGNPVAQAGVSITVAIQSGGGTLGGTLSIATDNTGAAEFTDLWIGGTAGERTLIFTAPGLASVTSSPVAVTTGTGSQLTLTVQPSATAQSGVVFGEQPVVQLRDAGGNPVPQAGVLVTAAILSGGGTLGGNVSVITSAAGTATFTDLSISGLVGARVLQFTASGITAVQSEPITLSAGPAAALSITVQPSATARSGVLFDQQPVVQLRDGAGNPVDEAGVPVTAAIASGGGSLSGGPTVNTDASGAATFVDLAIIGVIGTRTVAFSAPGLASVVSAPIQLAAGPVVLEQTSVTVPNGVAGAPTEISIRLRDASGNPVPGEASGLAVTITGANPAAPLVSDDGAGVYTAQYTPALTGTDTISITFGGTPVPGSPFSSSVRAGGVSGTNSTLSVFPAAGVIANGADAYQVTVLLRDTIGNAVGGIADAFEITVTNGAVIDEVVETPTTGTYMFRVTSTFAATVALMVSVGGTALAEEPTLEFVAGPAAGGASSVGVSRTTGVLADGMDAADVTVLLRDAFDNPVSGLTDANFAITLGSASGGATHTPVMPTPNPGEYTFAISNTTAEIVTITVVATGVELTAHPTVEFVAAAVSATQSTVSAAPLSAPASGTDSIIVTVGLKDAYGNAIPGAAASISVAAGTATASVVEETAAGTYRFGLTSTAVQSVSVQVTAGGVLLATQPTVEFTAGAVSPSLSTVTANPTAVEANGTSASTVTVTVRDVNGNLVDGASLSIEAPGANVSGVTPTGVGEYSFSLTSSTPGAVLVTVTANGVELDATPTVTFVAGSISATLSTATASPTTGVIANGTASSTVTVQLRDGSNNPITGVTAGEFTIVVTGGSAGAVSEDSPGTYVFGVTSTTAGMATVTVSARGITLEDEPTITFVPGPVSASESTATADPTVVVADGSSASTVTVTLRDANGNLIDGVPAGEFTLNVTGGTAGAITAAGVGVYTFPVTSTIAGAATVTITARGTQLSTQPIITFTAGAVDPGMSSITVPTTPVVVGGA